MNRTIEYFKDFYGCRASIKQHAGKFRLKVWTPSGTLLIHSKRYDTHRGAKIAMGKIGDSWSKVS